MADRLNLAALQGRKIDLAMSEYAAGIKNDTGKRPTRGQLGKWLSNRLGAESAMPQSREALIGMVIASLNYGERYTTFGGIGPRTLSQIPHHGPYGAKYIYGAQITFQSPTGMILVRNIRVFDNRQLDLNTLDDLIRGLPETRAVILAGSPGSAGFRGGVVTSVDVRYLFRE